MYKRPLELAPGPVRAVVAVAKDLQRAGCHLLSAHVINGRGRVRVAPPSAAVTALRDGAVRLADRWECLWACPVNPGHGLPLVQVEWQARRLGGPGRMAQAWN
jgi:hypothetical protein